MNTINSAPAIAVQLLHRLTIPNGIQRLVATKEEKQKELDRTVRNCLISLL